MSVIAYSNVTVVNVNDGQKGEQGISVIKVVPEYTVYTSSTSLPSTITDSDWSETKPSNIDDTHYLWTRYRTDLSNGEY
jgi:hypothetical protein